MCVCRLYVIASDPDKAIVMYKKQRMYNDMMRLVTKYHPDLVNATNASLAKVCTHQVLLQDHAIS